MLALVFYFILSKEQSTIMIKGNEPGTRFIARVFISTP